MNMHRLNLVSIIFALIALLSLNACDTGTGYSGRPWNYNSAPQTAEQPPNTLAETYGPATAQTPATMQNQPLPQEIPPADNLPPVKVGILLPLSGKNATLGQSMLHAAQIALFDVGAGSFELMPRDTQGTPDGAREAARSVLQDGAKLILGPVFSEEVKAARSITNEMRVNMIAFSTDWTQAGGNTFILGFLPFDQIERIITYAASHNLGRIGVIAPQTDYGRAVVSAYQTIAARTGVTTAEIVNFAANSSNLAPLLQDFAKYEQPTAEASIPATDIPATPPPFDAVLMATGGDTALSISNLMSNYKLPPATVKRLGTGLFDDPALAAEQSLNGAWFAAPSPRLRQSFEQRFQSTYGYRAPRLATLAYDATALAAVLAKRGLSAQGHPAFDRESISNPNGFAGVDGIFRFRADGTAERGLAVLEYKNGQLTIIDDAPKTFQKNTAY